MFNAATLLHDLTAAGVRIGLDRDQLTLSGDQRAINAHLADIRAHKRELIGLLAANDCANAPIRANAPSGDTYSEWLVTLPNGQRATHCFAPAKSRAEVLALYQGATVEPAPPEPEPTPLPPDAIPLVYAYLNHVGETCPATRTEFVTALERDHRRLAWLYGEVVRMGLVEPPEPPAVGLDARLEPTKANAVSIIFLPP